MGHAVRKGDIFNQPHAVQHVVLQRFEVREDVGFCEPQAGDPPLEVRIHSFAGKLRTGIDGIRAVHGAGAPGNHQAGISVQLFLQGDFPEEPILRGNMSARQDNDVLAAQIRRGLHIPVVAHFKGSIVKAAHRERLREAGENSVVFFIIGGIRANHEHPCLFRPQGTELLQQSVFLHQHGGDSFSVFPV